MVSWSYASFYHRLALTIVPIGEQADPNPSFESWTSYPYPAKKEVSISGTTSEQLSFFVSRKDPLLREFYRYFAEPDLTQSRCKGDASGPDRQ